jgi:uncharacterized membrane protein YccF (DUF307 family)
MRTVLNIVWLVLAGIWLALGDLSRWANDAIVVGS